MITCFGILGAQGQTRTDVDFSAAYKTAAIAAMRLGLYFFNG